MDDQPKVIPVSDQERIEGQQKAIEKLQQPKPNHQGEGGGRPTVVDEPVVLLLLTAFQNGLGVREACTYAGISKNAFYKRYNEDEKFRDKVERAKNNLVELAGNRIVKIIKTGDERVAGPLAWKVFERRMPELYGQQLDKQPAGGGTTNNFFLSVRDITAIFSRPDSRQITAEKLSQVLEAQSDDSTGRQEATVAPIHPTEIQSVDPTKIDLPEPPSTV